MKYLTKIITNHYRISMKSIIFFALLGILLFPANLAFSQLTEKESTLGIVLTSFTPYQFRDESGRTVVIGEVENTRNFPVTGIKIWVGFYGEVTQQPLQSTIGTTILEVIPPHGKSPYVIKSPGANAAITKVSVNLLGFNSAPPKEGGLKIDIIGVDVGETIRVRGTISNTGQDNTINTKVHLGFNDAFVPPRILSVSSNQIGILDKGKTVNFEFEEKFDTRATKYFVFAESTNYHSKFVAGEIEHPQLLTRLVSINDVTLTDAEGNKLSDVKAGSAIKIQSSISIQFATVQQEYEQPYKFYAQIKQSGEKPFVEFIGIFEGKFDSAGEQFPSVEWLPERKGLYFAETFVWDPVGVPLASKGPLMLILVT